MSIAANQSLAQSSGSTNTAVTLDHGSVWLRSDSDFLLKPRDPESTISGKRFQISGPLVAPMKSKKLWQFPLRLLHLINPFAKSEADGSVEYYRPVESMPWSTMIDWKGRTLFPDDTHHEPQMRLLSVSTGK